MMRTTHTLAVLEVSRATFDEVAEKLRGAEYDHAFHEGHIDMSGIALKVQEEGDLARAGRECAEAWNEKVAREMQLTNVRLTKAELDILCLGLQQLAGTYPKSVALRERLDTIIESMS